MPASFGGIPDLRWGGTEYERMGNQQQLGGAVVERRGCSNPIQCVSGGGSSRAVAVVLEVGGVVEKGI